MLRQLSVPYSKAQATVFKSELTDEWIYVDIDKIYRTYDVRDKVIIRIDLMNQLTDGILSKNADTSVKKDYLSAVSGLIEDVNELSKILKNIYIKDEQFKIFLANICYFELPKFKQVSLMQYLIANNKIKRNKAIEEFWQDSIITSSKLEIVSTWFLYTGVNDKADSVCKIPSRFKVEVISYAKKWNCVYPRAIR